MEDSGFNFDWNISIPYCNGMTSQTEILGPILDHISYQLNMAMEYFARMELSFKRRKSLYGG